MGLFPDIFTEMAVLLLLGALAVRLRQPLIVAFIAVGILVGPSVLGSVLGLFWLSWQALACADLFRAILLFVAFGLLMALARLEASDRDHREHE